MKPQWLRVASGSIAALSTAVLAHAQTAPPPAPLPSAGPTPEATAGSGALVLLLVLGLIALVGIGVKLYDRRRKREEEGVALQSRLSDVLLQEPALAGVPLVANVHMSRWATAPTVVEVVGVAPSAEVRALAMHRIERELAGLQVEIEDRVVIDPRMARRAA